MWPQKTKQTYDRKKFNFNKVIGIESEKYADSYKQLIDIILAFEGPYPIYHHTPASGRYLSLVNSTVSCIASLWTLQMQHSTSIYGLGI